MLGKCFCAVATLSWVGTVGALGHKRKLPPDYTQKKMVDSDVESIRSP